MHNNRLLFFTLYALTFSGGVFSKELLGTEELYYGSLAEQLTTEQLQQVMHMNNVWGWVGYATAAAVPENSVYRRIISYRHLLL